MGKKSKKGVSRAGTKKHPGAGNGRAKSDTSSRASRDNISLDGNPELTRLASESKAPSGPPPRDVVAMLNNLVAAAAAAELAANGASNKENFCADDAPHIGEIDDSPPFVGDVNDPVLAPDVEPPKEQVVAPAVADSPVDPSVIESTEVNVEEEPVIVTAAEPLKEQVTAPAVAESPVVVESPKPEISKVDVEPLVIAPDTLSPKDQVTAPPVAASLISSPPVASPEPETSVPVKVEPPSPVVETPNPPATIPADEAPKEVEVSYPVAESSPAFVSDSVKVKVSEAPKEGNGSVVQVATTKVEKVPAPNENDVPLNPLPSAADGINGAASNVWNQKLRDVVVDEPTKPVLDVTPPRKKKSLGAVPLDTPSAPEVEVKQTDCGCVIL